MLKSLVVLTNAIRSLSTECACCGLPREKRHVTKPSLNTHSRPATACVNKATVGPMQRFEVSWV